MSTVPFSEPTLSSRAIVGHRFRTGITRCEGVRL
jgi:hypothetical protein